MRIGRLLGAEVRLDPLLAVSLAAALCLGYLPEVAIFACALVLHEIAHLLAAASQEMAVSRLVLHPFGGVAHVPGLDTMDGRAVLPVAMAGPAANLLLAGAGMLAMRHAPWVAPEARLGLWVDLNLGMALVNLAPVLPLDGGQVARAHLAGRFGIERSGRALALAGRVAGVGLAGAAAVGLVVGWGLLDVGAFGIFLALAAGREASHLPYSRTMALEAKRAALKRGAILPERTLVAAEAVTLGAMWRALAPRAYHRIRVVDATGTVVGALEETVLYDALLRLGPGATLGDALDED